MFSLEHECTSRRGRIRLEGKLSPGCEESEILREGIWFYSGVSRTPGAVLAEEAFTEINSLEQRV